MTISSQEIFTQPWAIQPEWIGIVRAAAKNHNDFLLSPDTRPEQLEALMKYSGQYQNNTYDVVVRENTAVLEIKGIVIPRGSFYGFYSGMTTPLEFLAKDFQAALDNPKVKRIVFRIDSPGGSITAVGEFARMIYAARGKKKIIAYVQGSASSAGYWIASACSEIIINPSALVGSIGVIMPLTSNKKKREQEGYEDFAIVSSQSPDKNLDVTKAEDRAKLQKIVNDSAQVFVSDVAEFRGTTVENVLENYGKGIVLVGQQAVDAGMADSLGSFEDILKPQKTNSAGSLSAQASTSKENDMEKEEILALVREEIQASKKRGKTNQEDEELDLLSQVETKVTELKGQSEKNTGALEKLTGDFKAMQDEFEGLKKNGTAGKQLAVDGASDEKAFQFMTEDD
ncbi:S49 family peptidase [bacterium]|nr:S49 family peptidase [bacterium]